MTERKKDKPVKGNHYEVWVNRNHSAPIQLVTFAHELGHLFLGHLGRDERLAVPDRSEMSHDIDELEAEAVAYIVCERHGIKAKSETYLTRYVKDNTSAATLDLYQITRAAGQVETMLGLSDHTRFPPSPRKPRTQKLRTKL